MAAETTSTSAKAWSPDVIALPARDAVPDALILNHTTVAGSVEGDAVAVRVPYVDDATAQFTGESEAIPEADPALSEKLVYTGKVTMLVRVSREQYHQAATAGQLAESVRRAVTIKGNSAFIAQPAPTAPAVTPPAGLLNIPGIVNGGTLADSLDALADLLGALETNGAQPSGILAAPDAWSWLRKFKTASTENTSLLGAGTTDQDKRLFSLPVTTTPAVPAGTLLVVDRTAIVSAVGPVNVATSDDVYFATDDIGVRCTWRFGANIVRPTRVGKITVINPDAAAV